MKDKQALKAIYRLVSQGIEARNKEGATALMEASFEGETKIVKALILAGADVNVQDDDGSTPLRYALANYKTDIAIMLVKAGAKADLPNKHGGTPLDIATDEFKTWYAERALFAAVQDGGIRGAILDKIVEQAQSGPRLTA